MKKKIVHIKVCFGVTLMQEIIILCLQSNNSALNKTLLTVSGRFFELCLLFRHSKYLADCRDIWFSVDLDQDLYLKYFLFLVKFYFFFILHCLSLYISLDLCFVFRPSFLFCFTNDCPHFGMLYSLNSVKSSQIKSTFIDITKQGI